MASCLSGGGRAYGLNIDVIKSPSSTSWISNSPSPSSSLSESSNNSQIAISTRKPRTPRKRPNETYNEAAALLSKIYPKLFPTKHLTKPYKFTEQKHPFTYESSELLLHFQSVENSSYLIHPSMLENPQFQSENRGFVSEKPCLSPGEITSTGTSMEVSTEYDEDFDAESILDEEVEQGIESILGNLSVENESSSEASLGRTCYGYPVGLGYSVDFDNGFGTRNYIRAFRNSDNGEWSGYNSVNIDDITPKFCKIPAAEEEVAVVATGEKKKKKKKQKIEKLKKVISKCAEQKEEVAEVEEPINPKRKLGLLLKLDYDNVLNAWSERDSPFPDDSPAVAVGNDVQARLSAINLFTESGGIREARVLRYKEKRRTRLFSKKIRYQVRKVNADQRPRMQGRFVRRPNSPESEQG